MQKTILITGATGMIGGLILQDCLKSTEIKSVISIVRKPSGIKHKKLKEIIYSDFLDYSQIAAQFKNIDVAYYCIGVYTGAVPRDKFREITVDYTKAFAKILKEQSPGATLCFLSGMGADRTEKSRAMFAQDKGIAENFLLKQTFKELYLFRPGYIYPVTPRKEPNFSYKVFRWLYPVMRRIIPNGVIPSTDLARVIFSTGLHGGSQDTYENKDIRQLAYKK